MTVYSVQDETGTVTQLSIAAALPTAVAVGDVGIYSGFPDDGTASAAPPFQELAFVVGQVLDTTHFSVTTNNANMADWPANGQITWTAGGNISHISTVTQIDGANAYITTTFLKDYHKSRGNSIPDSATSTAMQQAIVKATDYLDQKYRYSGIKRLQSFGNAAVDANAIFLETWLTPYTVLGVSYLTPTTTTQSTEWPRQGVVDFNGDSIFGIPKQIKAACAELAIRVLNGVNLQPDYDPSLVGAGGIVSSITKKIGPLEKAITYDTKLGIGFFASFPIVDRMLNRAGLLSSGGGRTVMR